MLETECNVFLTLFHLEKLRWQKVQAKIFNSETCEAKACEKGSAKVWVKQDEDDAVVKDKMRYRGFKV